MLFTVQDVIGDRPKPVTAEPNEILLSAYERMRQHDYSQLPVVAPDGRPIGVVTSNSILRALSHLGVTLKDVHVRDAMDDKPVEYRLGDDLFALLDDLQVTYAVLIIDIEGRLIGIVTSYDTTEFFRRKNQNMMLVEDIETALKKLIHSAFSNGGEVDTSALAAFIMEVADPRQTIRKTANELLNRYIAEVGGKEGLRFDKEAFEKVFSKMHPSSQPRTLGDLTLYEFTRLIVHDKKKDYFQGILRFKPEVTERLLDGVRETRNTLAHFRGTISPAEGDRLQFCAEWLARVQQTLEMQRTVQSPATPTTPEVSSPVAPVAVEPTTTDEAEQLDDSKYTPLAIFLQGLPPDHAVASFDFEHIERHIIRGQLPVAARQHLSWWANDSTSHVQSRQWLEAGWRVEHVNLKAGLVQFVRIPERSQLYRQFYTGVLAALSQRSSIPQRASKNLSLSWIWTANLADSGRAVAHLGFSFAMGRRFRVELYIDSGDRDYNKRLFDKLVYQRDIIESELDGLQLRWERLDNKRASRVAIYHDGAITDGAQTLNALQEWAVATMVRFQAAIEPRVNTSIERLQFEEYFGEEESQQSPTQADEPSNERKRLPES